MNIFSKIKNIDKELFLHGVFFVFAIVVVSRIIYNESHDNQENKILYKVKTPYGTFEGLTPGNNVFADSNDGYIFIDKDGQEVRFYGSFSLTREICE